MTTERRTVTFRRWQHAALVHLREFIATNTETSYLLDATPGAGKTTFFLATIHLFAPPDAPVCIVVPTSHLKRQVARAAAAMGIQLDSRWNPSEGIRRGCRGVVTTYAHVGTPGVAEKLAFLMRGGYVILDEIHHASKPATWGDAIGVAFESARFRLLLSGTPFRSDVRRIPFVPYDEFDTARPHFSYGYAEALQDGGVVRPIVFPALDGEFEWERKGKVHRASFSDDIKKADQASRLRAALSLDGAWLPSMLAKADASLARMRVDDPRAGGLVIARNMDHARAIAERLDGISRLGSPIVVLSDDPKASKLIHEFADGDMPWLVAVRMVSEGVDVPRLRVGVYATNTMTEMFLRQAVGRVIRWRHDLGSEQDAQFFIPDDPRLRTIAVNFALERPHVAPLDLDDDLDDDDGLLDEIEGLLDPDDEADEFEDIDDGVFRVLATEATDTLDREPELLPVELIQVDDIELVFELPMAADAPTHSIVESISEAKDEAEALAARIARYEHRSERYVLTKLNHLAGIRKGISRATPDQIGRRVHHAEVWLAKFEKAAPTIVEVPIAPAPAPEPYQGSLL